MTSGRRDQSDLAVSSIVEAVTSSRLLTRGALEKAKKEAAVRYSLSRYVSNSEIIAALPGDRREEFEAMLRVHPRRSASGIVVVTAFSAPFACPHGTCVFCPGGPTKGTPQSYLPASPGMRAALAADFDPFKQVRGCLAKYSSNGHDVSKVETIIEGGTFIAVPPEYQLGFVKGVYDGLNGFVSPSLEEAQFANESADSRCVGLTLESKPDWCRQEDIDLMLDYGITRLEIGVQSLRDPILKLSNRGHTVEDTRRAFKAARDSGLKVTAHMMPGLPGSDPKTDLEDFRALFEDEDFRPDMMKVYPTLVVEGTSLERQHASGLYEPYGLETVLDLLSEMKRSVPRWHRIMRIQREIPAYEIEGGVKNGNLRELVLERVRRKGFACQCIRCREVALDGPEDIDGGEEPSFRSERYEASGGVEVFGSQEYPRSGRIAGFFRLRLPSGTAPRTEVQGACVVRELRVYGKVVSVGRREEGAYQHRGIGRALMGHAERIAREELGAKSVLVTSAVGTRDYYRRLGYERNGPYMSKLA